MCCLTHGVMEYWSTGVVGSKKSVIIPSLQYSITPIGAKPLSSKSHSALILGAGNGIRTRDPQLGRLTL
jgi:hypothetical protein